MRDRALILLFRRYRDGSDGAALAAIFDATSQELLDVACHLVRDPHQAEDLVQATFLTAIRKAKRFDERAPLKAWLYGILWREAAKLRRSSARRIDPVLLTPRDEPDPLDRLALAEVRPAVARVIDGLPRRYRDVLRPLLHEGRPIEEIARALERSPGTVRSQIHRGLERLRRGLSPGFAGFSGLAVVPFRGLGAVRAEVLKSAGFAPSTAATASLTTFGMVLGGVLVSKTALAGGSVAVVALLGGWLAWEQAHPVSPIAEQPQLAAPSSARGSSATPPSARDSGFDEDEAARVEVEAAARGEGRPAEPLTEATLRSWLARFDEAPEDWRHGWAVAEEIAALPPDEALAIMTWVWPHLSVAVKEQALKPFVFHGGHVHALKLLDLAAMDASLSVQSRAFTYLKDYAFQDFANDYEAYLRWAAANRDLPVGEVLTSNAQRFVAELLALTPQELGQRMGTLDRLDLSPGGPAGVDLAAVLRDAGGLRVLEACLGDADPEVQSRALRWSKTIQADESWLRRWALPSIERPVDIDPSVLHASFAALGRPDCAFARDSIVAYLARSSQGAIAGSKAAARALADIGDPAAVPGMIEVLLHDTTGEMAYDVGYFGLAELTGVKWQESYDGAWWLDWWEKNHRRFAPEVSSREIRR